MIMTTRTVKIFGLAYGSTPAEIAVTLDGAPVYTGTVSTLDQLPLTGPDLDSVDSTVEFCTFEIPMDFAGTKQMVITVTGAPVRFGQIVANYTEINTGAITYSSGADIYADVTEIDPAGIADPRGDTVVIDGQQYEANRLIGRGTWHWTVNPGSKFEHGITVSNAGLVG